MMIQQTKNAIQKLKKAGLSRDWYKVHTERLYIRGSKKDYGKAMYEWGNAQIIILATFDKIEPYTEAMAKAGLHVEIWIFDGFRSIRVTDEYGKAGLWEMDYIDTDDYGLPKEKRII